MGARVASFSDANPDTDEGNTKSAAKVKELTQQMEVVAAAQRAGLVDRSAGVAERSRLRQEILSGPVAHLSEVGKRAVRGGHELGLTFRYKPGKQTYVAFLTAVRSMQAGAEADKEVLRQYGLSDAVLVELGEMLDRFDAASLRTNNGRTAHKGATRQLERLASELASVVRTMDARNRLRFKDNAQLLASWISASTVLGTRREGSEPAEEPGPAEPAAGSTLGGTPTAGGEARPAA